LSDAQNLEHFGGVLVATGNAQFAALDEIDLHAADHLQCLPRKGCG
jgi:hypothetical protein